ncbi:armadillo-type protein [Mycena latifolia]|nr:armadillo-type protein [Mycena latifolia]
MSILSSYLFAKYVSTSTKDTILRELYERAVSEHDARTVVESLQSQSVESLLGSPDVRVRRSTCWMLGRVACHGTSVSTADMVIFTGKLCGQLVPLLRDTDIGCLKSAIYALSGMTNWPNGAQAAVDANILDYLKELLESSDDGVRKFTCWLLGDLARRKSTVLGVTLCMRLVAFLSDKDVEVVESALFELWRISLRPSGAQVVMDADVLHLLPGLLDSPNTQVRRWTCNMLGELARHDVISVTMKICEQVVSLLRQV